MSEDERAIRDLIATWMEASKIGDHDTVLSLMTDDVVFMVPGREPFRKEAFAAASKSAGPRLIEGTADIVELKVLGDWAWLRTRLGVTIAPPGGAPTTRSGYTLTILRKQSDGNGGWRATPTCWRNGVISAIGDCGTATIHAGRGEATQPPLWYSAARKVRRALLEVVRDALAGRDNRSS